MRVKVPEKFYKKLSWDDVDMREMFVYVPSDTELNDEFWLDRLDELRSVMKKSWYSDHNPPITGVPKTKLI